MYQGGDRPLQGPCGRFNSSRLHGHWGEGGNFPPLPSVTQKRNVAYWDGAWFGTKSVSRGCSIHPIPTTHWMSTMTASVYMVL